MEYERRNECSWRVQDKGYHFRILIRICDRLSTLLWYLFPPPRKVPNVLMKSCPASSQTNHWRNYIREIIEFESKLFPPFNLLSILSIYRSLQRIKLRRAKIFISGISYLFKPHFAKILGNTWNWNSNKFFDISPKRKKLSENLTKE